MLDGVTRSAQGVAPVFKEFSSGLVKLLQTAEWADSEVALLYSMPSNQISWMMDSEADGKQWNQRSDSYEPDHMSMFFSHVGWNKLLEDVGVKGRWMSYLELVNGTLATRGVKVLVLPRSLALSKAEREAIEQWVEAGGTLIADSLTGIWDGNLHRRGIADGGGWWDTFLGVKREDYSFVEMNGAAGSAYGNATAKAVSGAHSELPLCLRVLATSVLVVRVFALIGKRFTWVCEQGLRQVDLRGL